MIIYNDCRLSRGHCRSSNRPASRTATCDWKSARCPSPHGMWVSTLTRLPTTRRLGRFSTLGFPEVDSREVAKGPEDRDHAGARTSHRESRGTKPGDGPGLRYTLPLIVSYLSAQALRLMQKQESENFSGHGFGDAEGSWHAWLERPRSVILGECAHFCVYRSSATHARQSHLRRHQSRLLCHRRRSRLTARLRFGSMLQRPTRFC